MLPLDQMVCSEGACAGPALDHQVVELVDVTAGDQHLLGCDGRRIYLYDVAVTGPVVYPRIHDLAPYPRANGSVIDQPGYSTVHLERGQDYSSPPQQGSQSVDSSFTHERHFDPA